ncbi:MAG: hypothetical protein KBF30_02630, partial [Hyphomonadaceae bacterium]|nr:hypothetical protein [Hyphomonadaceae bacterium]
RNAGRRRRQHLLVEGLGEGQRLGVKSFASSSGMFVAKSSLAGWRPDDRTEVTLLVAETDVQSRGPLPHI